MQIVIYITLGFLLALVFIGVSFAQKFYIAYRVRAELADYREEINRELDIFFSKFKTDSHQNNAENLAKQEDLAQNNKQVQPDRVEPPFWSNRKKIEALRDSIVSGDKENQPKDSIFAGKTELEIWRICDERLLELENVDDA